MYHLIHEYDEANEVVATFPTMSEEAVKCAARHAVAGLHKHHKEQQTTILTLREYRKDFRLVKVTTAPAAAATPAATRDPRRSKYWSDKWGCDTQFPNTELLQARKDAMANCQPLPSV